MQSDDAGVRSRPSIEERAERRRALQQQHPDRYSSLIDVLRGDRPGRAVRFSDPAQWHPIMRQLIVVSVVIAALLAVGYVVSDMLRQGRIDAWSGPTATVTSGQEVLACLPADTTPDDQLPTWIRYGERVYARTDFLRPLRNQGRIDETGQVETGYRLDRMRILLPMEDPADQVPARLLVVIEPGPAATLYEWAPACQ
jgi:hypothetical protein